MDFVQKKKPGKEKTKKKDKKDKKRKTTKKYATKPKHKDVKTMKKIDEGLCRRCAREQLLYQFYENMYLSDNMIMKKKIKKQEKEDYLEKKKLHENRKIGVGSPDISKINNDIFKRFYGYDADEFNILRLLQYVGLEVKYGKQMKKYCKTKLSELFEERGDPKKIIYDCFKRSRNS